jgi:mono/diheme cytochrome c family protein
MIATKKFACPLCGVGLRVADTVPAGKQIKCPKCGDAFAVPAGGAPPRPRPEAPPAREDENPFELVEDQPAPRPRRKKKKAKGNNPLVLASVLAGAVLLIGTAAILAVVFWPAGKKSGPIADNTPRRMSSVASGATGGEVDRLAAGRRVFEANDCARCHAVGGGPAGAGSPDGVPRMGRGGRNRGPDLAHVGQDPAHTVAWLMEHVRDPKSHKPESRMPSFEGKISEDDLRALAEYLASLK